VLNSRLIDDTAWNDAGEKPGRKERTRRRRLRLYEVKRHDMTMAMNDNDLSTTSGNWVAVLTALLARKGKSSSQIRDTLSIRNTSVLLTVPHSR
jgi:hypothetical protein